MHVGVNTLSVIPGVTGGGETYLSGLLRGLEEVDAANRYSLFVSEENGRLFERACPRFERVLVACACRSPVRRVWYEHTGLPRLVRRHGVEVLYCPGNAAIRVRGCAQVVCIQSMLYSFAADEVGWLRSLYFRHVVPWSVRRAERVVAVSEDTRRRVLAAADIPAEKVRVVHEGVDSSFRRPRAADVERELKKASLRAGYVLFVSTLKPYKNADKLIRAMGCLREKHGLTKRLVIAGRDPMGLTGELRSLARGLGIEGEVDFLGGVDRERLPFLYAGADVFVFPSEIETFGLPVLEAMACGTPVIGSNRMAVPEIVGEAGLVVDPARPRELAGAILRVIQDAELREELRGRGLARAKWFSWQRAARETMEVFAEALGVWQDGRASETAVG